MKLSVEFDGWHVLSKKERTQILSLARKNFSNANFFATFGLIIEDNDEKHIFRFCLDILSAYKSSFNSWDGYTIKKLSKKILYNYNDKKRKLKLDQFKNVVRNSNHNDMRIVLAGTLYLTPDDVRTIIFEIERRLKKQLKEMNDKELDRAYQILLNYSSTLFRNLSLT